VKSFSTKHTEARRREERRKEVRENGRLFPLSTPRHEDEEIFFRVKLKRQGKEKINL
jgi:hypothetical protein